MDWWKELDPTERGTLVGLASVAVLVGIFLLIATLVGEGATKAFDEGVLLSLRVPGNPADPIGPSWLPEMARDVTSLGSFGVLGLLVAVVVIYLLMDGARGTAALVLVSVLGGTALSTVLKLVYDRPRPQLTELARVFTASFPSGHSMLAAVTYLTLGVLLARVQVKRRLKVYFVVVAVVVTLLVGVSRVYLGVHYPTDVLAGWSVGAAWAALCLVVATWFHRAS